MGRGDGQYVYVRAAEVESPVAVMAISTFEVRVCSGMRLHVTLFTHVRSATYMREIRW